MFKIFFPSWRFFDALVEERIVLEYRLDSTSDTPSDWKKATVLPRRPWHLFYNPMENLRLFLQSQLESVLEKNLSKNSIEMIKLENIARGFLLINREKALSSFFFRILIEKVNASSEVLFESQKIELSLRK